MADYSHVPLRLTAGDSWTWVDATSFASHPPPYWRLDYVLRPVSGGAATTLAATATTDAFTIAVAVATTAALAPGEYEWAAIATDDANGGRATLATGRLSVLPDPASATGDLRSRAERILAAIEATIEGRATKDADSYSIEGRSIARTPMTDLLRLRGVYRREVAAERNPGASPFGYRRIRI